MTITERHAPRISVQRLGAPDLISGQIGTGALVKDDIVMLPPEVGLALLSPDAPPVEILLGPAAVDSDAVLERRRVVSMKASGLAESDESYHRTDVVFATLDQPSNYQPVASRGDNERLVGAVRAGDDVWTALELAGGLPPGFRQPPDDVWLLGASTVFSARGPIIQLRMAAAAPSSAFCKIFWWLCH